MEKCKYCNKALIGIVVAAKGGLYCDYDCAEDDLGPDASEFSEEINIDELSDCECMQCGEPILDHGVLWHNEIYCSKECVHAELDAMKEAVDEDAVEIELGVTVNEK